jgi:two-component system sensor histidine kinase KdpD
MAPLDDIEPHTIMDEATRHTWLVRRVPLGTLEYLAFADLGTGVVDAKRIFNHRVDEALTEATETLARLDLVKAVEEFQLQIQADSLKNALVTTISHDLRNPLVSILGAASVLAQMVAIREDHRARSLVTMVYDEAARLDSNIQNIIAAARITTGVKQASAELTDPVDIVRGAIEQKRTQLAAHQLDVSLAPSLPLVKVQSALVENAVSQLLENAAKYSPSGSTIKIDGRVDQDWVVLSVSDQGIGLTPDERQLAGQRSFRGTRHAAAAAGSGSTLQARAPGLEPRFAFASPSPSRARRVRIDESESYLSIAAVIGVAFRRITNWRGDRSARKARRQPRHRAKRDGLRRPSAS